MATKQDEKAEQKFFAQKAKEPAKSTDKIPASGLDKIPSTHGIEAREEASKARAGRPGDVTTDQGPGKRLFQTGPEEHKWLTEAEAKAAGFFWKPDPDDGTKKKA